MSWNVVVVPSVVPTEFPSRKIWYPVTPTLSVLAGHDRLAVVAVTPVTVGWPGALGPNRVPATVDLQLRRDRGVVAVAGVVADAIGTAAADPDRERSVAGHQRRHVDQIRGAQLDRRGDARHGAPAFAAGAEFQVTVDSDQFESTAPRKSPPFGALSLAAVPDGQPQVG